MPLSELNSTNRFTESMKKLTFFFFPLDFSQKKLINWNLKAF